VNNRVWRAEISVGYGVEIAMLIDAWRAVGLDGLAQVHLGVRQNAHQSLRELSAMAYAVLVAASTRFLGPRFTDAHASGSIALPPRELEEAAWGCGRISVSIWWTYRIGPRDENALAEQAERLMIRAGGAWIEHAA